MSESLLVMLDLLRMKKVRVMQNFNENFSSVVEADFLIVSYMTKSKMTYKKLTLQVIIHCHSLCKWF